MDDESVILSERSELGAVRLSGHSAIHLTIGPITIHLAPDVFAQTALLIREAMESLAVLVAAGELSGEKTPVMKVRSPLPN
jgi:hypothetical protein